MKRKSKKPERFATINIRVSCSEKKQIEAMAKKFAKGNLSRWLRAAGISDKPLSVKALKLLRR